MKLYQAYVGEHQKSFLSDKTIPIDASININDGQPQREYELFKHIKQTYKAADVEPWGLVSWKFQYKCIITPEQFMDFASQKLAAGYDCAFINPMIADEALYYTVWEQGIDCGTQGLDKITEFLSNRFGSRINSWMRKSAFSFCNYFIATPKFWDSYFAFVDNVIQQLEEEAVKQTEIGIIYNGPAVHGISSQPLCTIKPFIIERLFSSFIAESSSCAAYEFPVEHYRAKCGDQLGNYLYKLSQLKDNAITTMDYNLLDRYNKARCGILYTPIRGAVAQIFDLAYLLSPECKSIGFS